MTRAPHELPDDDAPESTAHTLRDWLGDPEILKPPRVIVPHLAVEGRVTLLSGREKIGKSTLAAGAVAAASLGASWLGGPLEGAEQ
jgi:RecA-family ATPase